MSDSPPPLDIPLINLPASESHIPFLIEDTDLDASKPTIGEFMDHWMSGYRCESRIVVKFEV